MVVRRAAQRSLGSAAPGLARRRGSRARRPRPRHRAPGRAVRPSPACRACTSPLSRRWCERSCTSSSPALRPPRSTVAWSPPSRERSRRYVAARPLRRGRCARSGLSANKAVAPATWRAKVLDGTVALGPRERSPASPTGRSSARLTDRARLGPWTIDMFLLFQLRRLDVWPTGDLGAVVGYARAWHVPIPTAANSIRSAIPTAPTEVGPGVVLLAGGRALRGRRRQRAHPRVACTG